MARSALCALASWLAMAVLAQAAHAQTPFAGIHPHRGGPNTGGQASLPENSLEAFMEAHRLGAEVVEFDVKLTQDDVPVVMHDATLDRTTNCTGPVRQRTAADLAESCRIDTRGTDTLLTPVEGGVSVPRLDAVLDWARREQVRLNLEIKNYPTDPQDFDPTTRFAQTVLRTIEASGIPKELVLVQSFTPTNLDEAKRAGFQTSLLTLRAVNEQGIDTAQRQGYDVVSPEWPLQDPPRYVQRAHAAGKAVVPFTFKTREEMEQALAAGVDGLIVNDTRLAIEVVDGPRCASARGAERRAGARYRRARRAQRRAGSPRARRRAARRVRSARKRLRRAQRARQATCARLDALG